MSTSVEINGVTLIPIKEAAGRISYSRDYVARLAREGKIVASQIGRQWFVDFVSLENFSTDAVRQEEARKRELSTERKNERHVKERLTSLEVKTTARLRRHRTDALAVSLSALCLGLVVGFSFYTASLFSPSFLGGFPGSLAVVSLPLASDTTLGGETVPLKTAGEVHPTLLLTTVMEQPVFLDEAETRQLPSDAGGVMVFAETGAVRDASSVASLFSDDVAVTFTEDNSGVIAYKNAVGEVVEYPFVSVPAVTKDVNESGS